MKILIMTIFLNCLAMMFFGFAYFLNAPENLFNILIAIIIGILSANTICVLFDITKFRR